MNGRGMSVELLGDAADVVAVWYEGLPGPIIVEPPDQEGWYRPCDVRAMGREELSLSADGDKPSRDDLTDRVVSALQVAQGLGEPVGERGAEVTARLDDLAHEVVTQLLEEWPELVQS